MIKDTVSKIKELFRSRKLSYQMTFQKSSPYAQHVLRDLAKFCRAHDSTFTTDDRTTYMLEGRREVWLRLQNHLNLTLDEIYDLHQIRAKGE